VVVPITRRLGLHQPVIGLTLARRSGGSDNKQRATQSPQNLVCLCFRTANFAPIFNGLNPSFHILFVNGNVSVL